MSHPRGDRLAVARLPVRKSDENASALLGAQIDPRRDLFERSVAARAEPGGWIDHADADAGGLRQRRFFPVRAHDDGAAGSGCFASRARATRETGVRPRKSEMYLPAS